MIKNELLMNALKTGYNVIEIDAMCDAVLSGKLIMAADVRLGSYISVTPQNVFKYNKELCLLEVFTAKNHINGLSAMRYDLTINRELHFPRNEKKEREYMQEYIDKFIEKNYDFCYYLPEEKVHRKHYPARPINHIVIEEARSWLYSGFNS